ncbi:hypothetical protein [Agathobaculum sp.]|uniref:hypothetical protein n=1 Tax=Agathobaculum sp. TaxID=2048138 RepID=UPI0027BA3FDA|nr:hypothetical protein [Agathobaculum sp.]
MKKLICYAVITLVGVQALLAGFLLDNLGSARTVGYAWGAMILGAVIAIVGVYLLWTAGEENIR